MISYRLNLMHPGSSVTSHRTLRGRCVQPKAQESVVTYYTTVSECVSKSARPQIHAKNFSQRTSRLYRSLASRLQCSTAALFVDIRRRSQALTKHLPSRDLRPAEPDFRRHCEEGGHKDASRVRQPDRADLELALLLRALGVRPGAVMSLLVDAVEHVHAESTASAWTTRSEGETNALREPAAYALNADE